MEDAGKVVSKKNAHELEARGVFGCMMKRKEGAKADSNEPSDFEGRRMKPFNYTSRLVLGPKECEKKIEEKVSEMTEKRSTRGRLLKISWSAIGDGYYETHPSQTVRKRLPGGRYQSYVEWMNALVDFFGLDICVPTWQEIVMHQLRIVDVRCLIDHVVQQGNELFKDTVYCNSWVLCHDALGQWWTSEAQEHLALRGIGKERQLCSQGSVNNECRYHFKNVGNSPELMPLDSNLFADFMFAIKQHVAMSKWLIGTKHECKRFSRATPDEAWSTMERVWQVAPRSERIVQDIMRWPRALDKIIQAEGCVVPELDNRNGRRNIKSTYHSDVKYALEYRQQKITALERRHAAQ